MAWAHRSCRRRNPTTRSRRSRQVRSSRTGPRGSLQCGARELLLSVDEEVVDVDAGVILGLIAVEGEPQADGLAGVGGEIGLHELPAERGVVTTPRGLAGDG